ncbi:MULTISPECIES: carbohydrate porin [Vibrio]|uniref:carbohydrate porin n=1 Tax=Vibrio TaxID=662 RepID=UPI001493D203|nr:MULTISPECIES: carbohydrate porin [Vibrio]NOI87896.1 carbohydrate porin [Vibrio sp. 99K-1]NOI96712.1 carbohydrate porin [Vibrio sp. T3Y01]
MREKVPFTEKAKRFWLTLVGAGVFITPTWTSAAEEKALKGAVDYYVFGLTSSENLSDQESSAAAGIARITLNWLAYQKESDTGALQLRVDHKHGYTDSTPSEFVMDNVGGFGLIQPAFSDIGLRLTNLYWTQTFNKQSTDMMVGFLDTTDYVDTYQLGNPYYGFSNLQFSTGSGSIPIPDESTFGGVLRHMMSENYYFYASFSDAKADSTKPFDGVEQFINDNQYFKSLEIGWVESKDDFYLKNSHLTVWHSDGRKEQASENYGANWSSIYKTGSWIPFFRAGVAQGPEALYKSSVVLGSGYSGVGPGLLGVAVGWAKPNSPRVVDESYNSEIYYRINWGPISLTPNVQYLYSLPNNSKADDSWVVGLRGNIHFSF